MDLRGIGYLGVTVPDRQAWSDFATGVIGLMPAPAPPAVADVTYLKADERQWRIAVHEGDHPGLAYLGFEVQNRAAFERAVESLTAQGAAPQPASAQDLAARGVSEMAYVIDPNGFRVEVFWGPVIDFPFDSAVGATGFVTTHGFGHVVLLVADLDKAAAFYTGVLGFRLSDCADFGHGMGAQFLRCTPRHHTVAVIAVGGVIGLQHIAFEVPDIDQVGLALDRATQAGAQITASLGRHKNDQMLSFYMRSPAGFDVEVGCGPRLIDEDTWIANRFVGDLWGHHGLTAQSVADTLDERG
jgi:3,4-dihydroxy-9,10-secoandrosta-1,3,5(10)-triene-9,17-dione 4,5-dioxygenase